MRNYITYLPLWWKFKGQYLHLDLYRSIKNLFTWFTIICKDRDYDYSSIYDILEFKLNNMLNSFIKNNRYVKNDDNIKYIKLSLSLIKKIKDDYYIDLHHDIIDEKWGESDFYFKDIEDKPGYSSMEMRNPNIDTPEKQKEYSEFFSLEMKKGYKKQKKAKKLLFTILEEKIETWWI